MRFILFILSFCLTSCCIFQKNSYSKNADKKLKRSSPFGFEYRTKNSQNPLLAGSLELTFVMGPANNHISVDQSNVDLDPSLAPKYYGENSPSFGISTGYSILIKNMIRFGVHAEYFFFNSLFAAAGTGNHGIDVTSMPSIRFDVFHSKLMISFKKDIYFSGGPTFGFGFIIPHSAYERNIGGQDIEYSVASFLFAPFVGARASFEIFNSFAIFFDIRVLIPDRNMLNLTHNGDTIGIGSSAIMLATVGVQTRL